MSFTLLVEMLKRINPLIFVAVILSLALGAQTLRLHSARASLAEEKAGRSADRARAAEAAASASEAYRAEESRIRAEQKGITDEADQQAVRLADDRRAAPAVNQRLRDAQSATAARSCATAGDPRPPGPGPAASTPADLLAYVQSRLDEAEDRIVDFADDSSLAGITCKRSYDALKAKNRKVVP